MATYPQYFQLGQNLPKTVGGPLPIGTPDYIIKMLEAAGVQPAPAYSQARPVPMPVVRAAEAIRSIESSNNYRALGPTIDDPNSMYYGDRAYGAYQVMGKNIGPWTREVLGKEMTPEEFLADRAAQDKVFQAKFGQSFYKHGNLEDAASTWFTGQPLSRGAGRSDTLGTTGSEYVDRFLKALPSEEGDPMDIRNMAALQPAQPQPAQPQQSRMAGLLSDPALFENLALAFNTLRMTPDQNLATVIRGRQERRADTATRNRTIEFLRQRGREDLAAAVESGAIDAKTAAAQIFAKPERTAMQQNYEFLVAQGMTPEQALQAVRSGTTVQVGDGMPGLGKLSTDFTYVLDPATGKPAIDPQTGLPRAVPVPGSKAAQEAEAEARQTEAQKAEVQALGARAGGVVLENIARIQKIAEESNLPIAGAIGAFMSKIPGTDAYDVSSLTRTIRANIGFDRLQQMREASPTGGALGNVSNQELDALQSVLGDLDQSQSQEQFEYNLRRLGEIYTDIMRKFSAYPNAAEFGIAPATMPETSTGGAPDFSKMTDAELDAYIAEQGRIDDQLRGR